MEKLGEDMERTREVYRYVCDSSKVLFVFGKVDVLRKSLCLDLKMWRIALMDCVVSFLLLLFFFFCLNEDCVVFKVCFFA